MKSQISKKFTEFEKLKDKLSLDEYKILIVKKGELSIIIEEHKYFLKTHSLIYIPAWQKWNFNLIPNYSFEIQILCFFLNEIILLNSIFFINYNQSSPQLLNISFKYISLLKHLTRILNFHLNNQITFKSKSQVNKYFLNSILLIIDHCFSIQNVLINHKYNFQIEITYKFLLLANDNYKKEHSVDYYAEKLNISRRYLSKIIKQNLNKTPKIILEDLLNQEALLLISEGNRNFSEISVYLGFNSYISFLLFFKNRNGITPSFYKKMIYTKSE